MKPIKHAESSVTKFGGQVKDYLEIHNFMDSSKAHIADHRHRALFHSAFGCFIVEKVFGITITNSDNKEISTRDIAEQHILEDLGFIPTFQDYANCMTIEPWMGGSKKQKVFQEGKELNLKDLEYLEPGDGTANPNPVIVPLTAPISPNLDPFKTTLD